MPELAQDAPIFDEIGAKYHEAWLAHWINDPHDIRPRSLMPRVFHGEEGNVDQRAADLAAYFASLGKPEEETQQTAAAENAPLGGALFANLGCIACHTTPDAKGGRLHGTRVSFPPEGKVAAPRADCLPQATGEELRLDADAKLQALGSGS
jgi:cytochrome c2